MLNVLFFAVVASLFQESPPRTRRRPHLVGRSTGYTLPGLRRATPRRRQGKEFAAIVLWEERDGRWRWAYRDENVEILSNHPYGTEAEARAAAAIAYPDEPQPPMASHVSDEKGERPGPLTLLLGVTALWRWYRRARNQPG